MISRTTHTIEELAAYLKKKQLVKKPR